MVEEKELLEVRASAKYVRISPFKARQIIELIRLKDLDEARVMLQFTPKKAAKLIGKVLDAAAANAEHNHNLNQDELYVSKCFVDEGPIMKRWRPRAMGRATPIKKRTSHINIYLSPRKIVATKGKTKSKKK